MANTQTTYKGHGTFADQLKGVKGFFRTLQTERDIRAAERQRLQQLRQKAAKRKGGSR